MPHAVSTFARTLPVLLMALTSAWSASSVAAESETDAAEPKAAASSEGNADSPSDPDSPEEAAAESDTDAATEAAPAAESGRSIPFVHSLDELQPRATRPSGSAEPIELGEPSSADDSPAPSTTKPVVVTFTSSSCGWCRKMATSTFTDERVLAYVDRFQWAKLDLDDEPALAARLRVRGVPHTFILDADEQVIASQPGYLPARSFVNFLQAAIDNSTPIDGIPRELLEQLSSLDAQPDRRALVRRALERIAAPEAIGRDLVLDTLAESTVSATPELVGLLEDERLALRAASFAALRALHEDTPDYDPFSLPAVRGEQLIRWRTWLERQPPAPPEPASEVPEPAKPQPSETDSAEPGSDTPVPTENKPAEPAPNESSPSAA